MGETTGRRPEGGGAAMKCDQVELLLVDDVRGDLAPDVAEQVRAHVEQCASCRAMREEMEGTLGVLAEGFKEARKQTLRLDDLHRGRIMLSRKPKAIIGWGFLKAAALVLALGGLAGMLLPALSTSRSKARDVTVRCEQRMRMKDMAPACAVAVGSSASADRDVSELSVEMVLGEHAPLSGAQDQMSAQQQQVDGVVRTREEAARKKSFSYFGGRGKVYNAKKADSGEKIAEQMIAMEPIEQKLEDKAEKVVEVQFKQAQQACQMAQEVTVEKQAGEMAQAAERVQKPLELQPQMKRAQACNMALDQAQGMGMESADSQRDEGDRPEAAPEREKLMSLGAGGVKVKEGQRCLAKVERQDRVIDAPIKKIEKALNQLAANKDEKLCEVAKELKEASDELLMVDEDVEVPIQYNEIIDAAAMPLSTFAIDVDTASFTMARRALLGGRLPAPASVRVEEFINAFDQDYRAPEKKTFAVIADRARSPFRPGLELVRIGVRGKVLGRDQQKPSVLTLVVDTSGSMNTPDRIGLMRQSIRMLADGLGPADRLAVVTFGAKASLALDMTPMTDKTAILAAVNGMETQGSTHLEGGLRLGYEIAARHFGSGCLNRVILLSDGVANLGAATASEILKQVESYRKQGIYCSVYGFGQGTYNDDMLESLADKGDGVYRFIDSQAEVRRAFVDDLAASFQVIAKDVKIQVEFDPSCVKSYRQLGYENRQLQAQQFRDDRVDAGEVGSGQSATALYEVELTGEAGAALGVVRIRWQDVATSQVQELAESIQAGDRYADFGAAPVRFRLTAGAAELAGVLRGDPISTETRLPEIAAILRPVGLELSLDRQVQDLVKMVNGAMRLKK